MKNFLKYVGVFSASLILLIIGVEYMLRQVPNALAFKKELIYIFRSIPVHFPAAY